MSLTPKQRKKWHIMVKDERGVGRRMYYDGCFKIKFAEGIRLVGGPSTVQKIEESVGQRIAGFHPAHPGQGQAFQDRIAENHTGNHYRNRTVRVTSAPNEPVRGWDANVALHPHGGSKDAVALIRRAGFLKLCLAGSYSCCVAYSQPQQEGKRAAPSGRACRVTARSNFVHSSCQTMSLCVDKTSAYSASICGGCRGVLFDLYFVAIPVGVPCQANQRREQAKGRDAQGRARRREAPPSII